MINNKKYEPYKILGQMTLFDEEENHVLQEQQKDSSHSSISFDSQAFAEIEIDYSNENTLSESASVPTFVSVPQEINPLEDEKRKVFNEMRQISRDSYNSNYQSKFYNKQVQSNNAKVFYKQAVFMKDFEDDYDGSASFSSYFPYYQLMSYEQLRTYFTWRTNVRKGEINNTSLSYAFLYMYELLNNIGVDSPDDGLERIMTFWNVFKEYNSSIDKYVIQWIKDYHIYYGLKKPFKDFVYENNIYMYYPKIFLYESDISDNFELFCSISKYNIKDSSFYTAETSNLINDCFYHVITKLKDALKTIDIDFYDLIFQPTKNLTLWTPFKGALFFQRLNGKSRKVILSDKEIYVYNQVNWSFSTTITTENGRQLIGYAMKQMESTLRKLMDYKYKLSVSIDMINQATVQKFSMAGIDFEKIIVDTVNDYYKEINKVVVSVSENMLNIIRKEAFETQEKLIVPENDEPVVATEQITSLKEVAAELVLDGWTGFKNSLNDTEIRALLVILEDGNIKQYADENSIMLEVLADSINEKAMDSIGDNILELDIDMTIYEEYIENVKEIVGV